MNPSSFQNLSVLITGATTGIGRDLAELFAADKANLILVARHEERLRACRSEIESRHGVRVTVIPQDLSRHDGARRLVETIRAQNLPVDVVVNNAGYGVYGYFHEEPLDAQIGMIDLHCGATTALTHAFLPGILKNKRGGILNVASTGGFQPVGIENVYCATKAYVVSFTEALAEELRGRGILVTCLCPGPTETPFFSTPLMKMNLPVKIPRMTSMDVARIGFNAFKSGDVLCITGWKNRLLLLGSKFAPRAAVRRAAKLIVQKHFKRQP